MKKPFNVCEWFTCMYVWVAHVCLVPACRGQRTTGDLLTRKMKLQTAVTCQRVLGIEPRFSRKVASAFN